MSLIEIIILGIVLGIDCLVVSFSQALVSSANRLKNSILLAISMGFFQGLFPCFGYLGTSAVDDFVEPFSHLLVFGIFMVLGVKFITEAFNDKIDGEVCCLDFKCIILMGIATSIDAFASGITLQLTDTPLLLSVLIIGAFSFVMSLLGFNLGIFFKKLPSKSLEILAGIILMIMAVKAWF